MEIYLHYCQKLRKLILIDPRLLGNLSLLGEVYLENIKTGLLCMKAVKIRILKTGNRKKKEIYNNKKNGEMD